MLESRYKETIYRLEDKLVIEPKCVDSLNGWIGSYHALSGVYLQQGDDKKAMKCLLIPHQSMLYMATHEHGDEEAKLIAYIALKFTLPPIMEFTKQHPLCEECMQELQSQFDAIESNTRSYH